MSDQVQATRPLVSVVVPTYQHAQFIAQCLDGILMQRASFSFEILVGEDESTDGTRKICERYAAEHPDRIRLFLRSRKDVIHINGKPTGRANLLGLFQEAKGAFIAWCDGDDAWIDPNKLQLQVDALLADPDAVACFTNAWNESDGVRSEYLNGTYTKVPNARVEQSELLNAQGLPTCTFICRTGKLRPLPDVLRRTPTCDTVLYTHISNFGHFIYLPVITAVRHVHPGGVHSSTSAGSQYLTTFGNLPFLDEVSHFRHHALIVERQRRMAKTGWVLAQQEGRMDLAKICWRIMAGMRKEVGWGLATTIRNYLKVYWPRTEGWAGRLWDRGFTRS